MGGICVRLQQAAMSSHLPVADKLSFCPPRDMHGGAERLAAVDGALHHAGVAGMGKRDAANPAWGRARRPAVLMERRYSAWTPIAAGRLDSSS